MSEFESQPHSPEVERRRVDDAPNPEEEMAAVLEMYASDHPDSRLMAMMKGGRIDPKEAFSIASEFTTDRDTGLPRKDLLPYFIRERMKFSSAQNRPLAIAVLDIDDFKKINSELSHLGADEVLHEVATITREITSIMHEAVRDQDIIGLREEPTEGRTPASPHAFRFGGEEFVVMFQGATADQAAYACRRLIDRVKEELADRRPGNVPITLSAGVTEYRPDRHGQGESTSDYLSLLKEADLELLKAKEHPGKGAVYPFDAERDVA